MSEGMMTPPSLMSRYITKTWVDNQGGSKTEINPEAVQQFINEAAASNNRLIEHINYLHRQMDEVKPIKDFVDWVTDHHPNIGQEYKDMLTANQVANRLENSHVLRGEA